MHIGIAHLNFFTTFVSVGRLPLLCFIGFFRISVEPASFLSFYIHSPIFFFHFLPHSFLQVYFVVISKFIECYAPCILSPSPSFFM